ncbi:hypothetical protein TSAR_007875, partial [Trichomalopsis sarcophagae]
MDYDYVIEIQGLRDKEDNFVPKEVAIVSLQEHIIDEPAEKLLKKGTDLFYQAIQKPLWYRRNNLVKFRYHAVGRDVVDKIDDDDSDSESNTLEYIGSDGDSLKTQHEYKTNNASPRRVKSPDNWRLRVSSDTQFTDDANSNTHKNVTLDENSWDILKDQFDAISAYFNNSYSFYHEFGHPVKVSLTNHDLNFSSSYGTKSILIVERPKKLQPSEEEEDDEISQPACKKIKTFNNPPGIVIQQPTFEGLRTYRSLIDQRLDFLKTLVGKVNRTYDYILEYLKIAQEAEEPQNLKNILIDYKIFKQFYAQHNATIEGAVQDKMIDDSSDNFKEQYLKIVLSEIRASELPFVAKDVQYY